MAREVYDVSGAGDTVTACVAVALAAGASDARRPRSWRTSPPRIEVGKPGVAIVTPDELRAVVATATHSHGLLLDRTTNGSI